MHGAAGAGLQSAGAGQHQADTLRGATQTREPASGNRPAMVGARRQQRCARVVIVSTGQTAKIVVCTTFEACQTWNPARLRPNPKPLT